jgi:hypothetical protein
MPSVMLGCSSRQTSGLTFLLGAIDYNPDGYEDWIQKHTVLTRLLPVHRTTGKPYRTGAKRNR